MKAVIFILVFLSFKSYSQAVSQDSACGKTISILEHTIQIQDTLISELKGQLFSLRAENKEQSTKIISLASQNNTLKKANNKKTTLFKIADVVIQGFILYFTSKH